MHCNENKNKKTNYINASIPNKKLASRIYYYNFFISWWRNSNPIIRKIATLSNSILGCIQKFVGIDRWSKTGMRLYHGSSWWSVSDEFADYLLSKFEWIKSQFGKLTFAADEFVPQTVIMNSLFKDTLYRAEKDMDDSLRLIDWTRGNGYGSPHIWQIGDKIKIFETKNLIGRKFDETVDNDIIDCVMSRLWK